MTEVLIDHLRNRQGRREVGGGPGQIFFRGPYLKIFFGSNFFPNTLWAVNLPFVNLK
jgi:hypothetical protein